MRSVFFLSFVFLYFAIFTSCNSEDDSLQPFDYDFRTENMIEGTSAAINLQEIAARRLNADQYQINLSFSAVSTEELLPLQTYQIQGVFVQETGSDITLIAKTEAIADEKQIQCTHVFSNKEVSREIIQFKSVKIRVKNLDGQSTVLTKLIVAPN